ncbi:MAG: CPBP family intramembrane metalloprotease, partial [Chlamydiia bacterium]|nr:CPBP family intramembrane metalloprotease [Chlamydiia bacterium]
YFQRLDASGRGLRTPQVIFLPLLLALFILGSLMLLLGISGRVPIDQRTWVLLVPFIQAALLPFVLRCFGSVVRRWVWWRGQRPSISSRLEAMAMGALTTILMFPFVLLIAALLRQVLSYWDPGLEGEQTAVKEVRAIAQDPQLRWLVVANLSFAVPFVEELWFRGALQSTLRHWLAPGWAIAVTSILFGMAHFTVEQGLRNVEVIGSLFVFSLGVGYVYERQGSLWAPLAAHGLFNFMSSMAILFGDVG